MIVGFSILNFRGCEKEAVDFISQVCVLEDPEVAQNIVNLGVGVNVFSKGVTLELLEMQTFECSPIEVGEGEHLVVSTVDFVTELLYNDEVLRLLPTEYVRVSEGEVFQFEEYQKLGIITVIPEVDWQAKPWILSEGVWNDDGVWIDDCTWEDA